MRPYAVRECVAFLHCMRVTRALHRDLARYLCSTAMRMPTCGQCGELIETPTRSWAEHVAVCDNQGYRMLRAQEAKRHCMREEYTTKLMTDMRAEATQPCVVFLHCAAHVLPAAAVTRIAHILMYYNIRIPMRLRPDPMPLVMAGMMVAMTRTWLERRGENTYL